MASLSREELGPPRVIIGVSPAQQARHVALGGKHRIRHTPEAAVVVVDPYRPPENALVRRLLERDVLQQGAILVRSPFGTGEYAPIEEAPRAFEQEKIHLIAELCRILGATHVQTKAQSFRLDDEKTTVRAKAGRKLGRRVVGSVDVSADEQRRAQWSEQLAIDIHYPPGAEPDLGRAQEFVTKHHLNDRATELLLKARSGPLAADEFDVQVTYESKNDSSIQAALKVSIPTVSAEGSVRGTRSSVARITMGVHVRF